MTISANSFITDLGIQLGDPSASLWPRPQVLSFIKRAYRISWPWFFKTILDDYTYTGLNAVPINTRELNVPDAFFPTANTNDVAAPGEITGLEIRLTGTTTPVDPVSANWFFVNRAAIDAMSLYPDQMPQIRFLQPYNNIFEMRVHGCVPLAIPTADDTTPLDGSDYAGFLEWLTCQTMVYCMANKETNTNDDKRGFGRRHLLDQADADKMRWRYRMSMPHYTQFTQVGR